MRTYVLITAVIFTLVTLGHLLRLVFAWPVVIAGWAVPMWISWVAAPVAGALSVWAFRLSAGTRR